MSIWINVGVAAGTIALALVAFFQLLQLRTQYQDGYRPVLVFRFRNENQRTSYRLINFGRGPAFDIELEGSDFANGFTRLDSLPADDALPPDTGDPQLQIAFREHREGEYHQKHGHNSALGDPRTYWRVSYRDVWGRTLTTEFKNTKHSFEPTMGQPSRFANSLGLGSARMTNLLLCLFTACLVVTSALQWGELRRSRQDSLRAWLTAHAVDASRDSEGAIHFKIRFENSGRTPAVGVSIWTGAAVVPSLPGDVGLRATRGLGVFAAETTFFSNVLVPAERVEPELERLYSGEALLIVVGRVQYLDIFEVEHTSRFCMQAVWTDQRLEHMTVCDRLNSMN